MTTDTAAPGAAIVLAPSGRLSIEPGQEFWSPEQIAALKALGITGATNGDLAVFFHQARRMRLDPFSRQIYLIGRRTKEKWQDERGQWQEQWVTKQTIQIGIDGFRVTRDRVAAEQHCDVEFEDTVWYDAKGGEHTVWLTAEPPAACRVVLLKHLGNGRVTRFPAVLRTASYMQTNAKGEPVSQWRTQAEHMIEKCCEAFATRRAFPNDFSGVYLEEEMGGRTAEDRAPAVQHRPVTVGEITGQTDPEPEVAEGEIVDEPVVPTAAPTAGAATSTTAASAPGRAVPAGTSPERRTRAGQPASPKQVQELNELLARLPLGLPDEREADERTLLGWLAGGEWTATRSQVTTVFPILDSFVEAAGGDTEAAVTAIWTRYHEVNGGDRG